MKLYLSSYRVPTPADLTALVGKSPSDIKVAIIPNAKDVYIKRIWDMKTKEVVDFFATLGISNCGIIDLHTFGKPKELKTELKKYDFIWANGGNAFALRYAMKASGFDKIIRELVDEGIVYGGESAGQIVAGPTLRGVESADRPEYAEEIVWDGLGLIDEFIFPHADDPMYAETITEAKSIHRDLIELKNSQAFIIDGDDRKIVEKAV